MIFWIIAIVFGIVMLRRGGDRAERFFIAGACIKLLGNLASIPWIFISLLLHRGDFSITLIKTVYKSIDILFAVISMTGILCFIYAFWLKFKTKKVIEISP